MPRARGITPKGRTMATARPILGSRIRTIAVTLLSAATGLAAVAVADAPRGGGGALGAAGRLPPGWQAAQPPAAGPAAAAQAPVQRSRYRTLLKTIPAPDDRANYG